MKKDHLERFIRDNRDAFDQPEPPAFLWQAIEQKLDKKPASRFGVFRNRWYQTPTAWLAAASVVLLVGLGLVWRLSQNPNPPASVTDMQPMASPYTTQVARYTSLIDQKRTELRQLTQQNPALYQEFSTDLQRLEQSYKGLQADLPQNPNQETLIRAMIQNLEYQLDLLNQQLSVMERVKKHQHENPI